MRSILQQTFTDLELLIVDDASVDGTRVVADHWASRDARVRVLAGPGEGIVSALELARREARGGLLARMDGDDVALPQRLERQVSLMRAHPRVGLCGTKIRYVPEDDVRDGARR